jgi:hypothetical protein
MANTSMQGEKDSKLKHTLDDRLVESNFWCAPTPRSDLRQVPDSQEVLLALDDNTTFIVEVLQSVKEGKAGEDLQEAIRFHFASLANDNAASSSEVLELISIPVAATGETGNTPTQTHTPTPVLLTGEQKIKKFGREHEPEDRVRIHLALWRLTPAKDVDLIMSLNEPLLSSNNYTPSEEVKATFVKAASTLQIQDWNLFA